MGKKDPRIDAYIAKSADFAKPILTELRKRVHAACPDVVENIKWSMPFFEYQGKLFAHLAAFKAHASFGFAFAKMREAGKAGEAMGHLGRLTSVKDLPSVKDFTAMAKEAMKMREAGESMRPPKPKVAKKELAVPGDFLAAMKKNKKALATFEAFSYSNRKEYVEWITEAKREETRSARMKQAIEWMAEGKPRNWKYMNC
jgi:uncharacterized protein YdhG (YjbR/CyaY superfamily)